MNKVRLNYDRLSDEAKDELFDILARVIRRQNSPSPDAHKAALERMAELFYLGTGLEFEVFT